MFNHRDVATTDLRDDGTWQRTASAYANQNQSPPLVGALTPRSEHFNLPHNLDLEARVRPKLVERRRRCARPRLRSGKNCQIGGKKILLGIFEQKMTRASQTC
jgi:hypothetical protein